MQRQRKKQTSAKRGKESKRWTVCTRVGDLPKPTPPAEGAAAAGKSGGGE